MIKSSLIFFFRQLKKNKFFYLVNITGLCLGMTSSMVIVSYLLHEYSFDKHHENGDRVVRIVSGSARTPIPLGPALKEISGVENFARMIFYGTGLTIKDAGNDLIEEKYYAVDSTFFQLFTHRFVAGSAENSLRQPNEIVITERTARKYFRSPEDAYGKTLDIFSADSIRPSLIKGVIKDPPPTSQFDFDILTLYQPASNKDNWTNNLVYTYALLKPGSSLKNFGQEVKKLMGRKAKLADKEFEDLEVQPLTSIHLEQNKTFDFGLHTSRDQLIVLLATCILILLIACINFVNLSTAKSYERLKEIGLKKTLGAGRIHLMIQSILEAIFISYIAFLFSLATIYFLSPLVRSFTGSGIGELFNSISSYYYLIGFFPALVGSVAGLYPAFFISSQPVLQSIKSQQKVFAGSMLRKALVTAQFMITVFLLASTYIVSKQLNFMKEKDLGFDKEQLLVINAGFPGIGDKLDMIRHELSQNKDVISVSAALTVPGDPFTYTMPYSTTELKNSDEGGEDMAGLYVDRDFVKNMGMHIMKGRGFSKELSTDSLSFILNETAANRMIERFGKEWADPIGKKLNYFRSNETGWWLAKRGTVIGVVKDFNFYPLYKQITPLVIQADDNLLAKILVKVSSADVASTIRFIHDKWKDFNISKPFNYKFLDQNFLAAYEKEQKFEKLFSLFSFLSIFISALGLYGMILFIMQKRLKELSIRKLLGASGGSVAILLSREFFKPVMVAFVVTIPVSYFFIQKWLDQFAYRVAIKIEPFLFSIALCAAITLAIIIWHTFKLGNTNPVRHLKENN